MIYLRHNNIIIRDSIRKDVQYLNNNLRQSDIEEVRASHNYAPYDALDLSFNNSLYCLTADVNDIPVCMFGVCPDTLLGDTATIWLLASKSLSCYNKSFIKISKVMIKYFLQFYPKLYNFVDNRNKASLRWLKSCGAKINNSMPYGVKKMPFNYFQFERGY